MSQRRNFALITAADLVARSAYQMGKTPLLPIFAATLGATGATLGFIVSVSTLTGMVLKPFIGLLSDRWGRRIWLIAGTAFFALMPFLYRFVHTPDQLFAIRITHGLATAIYGPVTLAFIAEQSESSQRAGRFGLFGAARSMGYIVGPAVAGWLLLSMDPVQVFTVIGFLSILVFVPILLLPKPVPVQLGERPPLRRQFTKALKSGGRTPAVWLSGALNAVMYIALYAIKAFLPIYGLSIGMSVVMVGLFFSVQEAAYMIARPLGGRFGDRWGHRTAIFLGMSLLGLTLPMLTLAGSGPLMLLLAGVMGLAQSFVFPSTIALVSTSVDPQHLGAGMGLVGSLDNAGKVIGPILGGLLIQRFDFALTIQLVGLFLLLSAGISWAWSRFYPSAGGVGRIGGTAQPQISRYPPP